MSRRRYRWNPETQAMEELSADWTDAERRAPTATEGLVYGNLGRATDGTPIDSRTKHREYMREKGLTVASDYTETWAKAEKERAKAFAGDFDRQGRREDIARALYQHKRGKR